MFHTWFRRESPQTPAPSTGEKASCRPGATGKPDEHVESRGWSAIPDGGKLWLALNLASYPTTGRGARREQTRPDTSGSLRGSAGRRHAPSTHCSRPVRGWSDGRASAWSLIRSDGAGRPNGRPCKRSGLRCCPAPTNWARARRPRSRTACWAGNFGVPTLCRRSIGSFQARPRGRRSSATACTAR